MSGFKRYQTFGGKVVLVQKIKGFEFDRVDATATVVLEDGTKRTRPLVHGFAPQIGDFYVMESTADHQYAPAEIVQRSKLSQYFVEMPEPVSAPPSDSKLAAQEFMVDLRKEMERQARQPELPVRSGKTLQFYGQTGKMPDPFAGVELVEPKPQVHDNSRAAAVLNAPYDLSELPPEGDPYTAYPYTAFGDALKVAEAADSKQEKPE